MEKKKKLLSFTNATLLRWHNRRTFIIKEDDGSYVIEFTYARSKAQLEGKDLSEFTSVVERCGIIVTFSAIKLSKEGMWALKLGIDKLIDREILIP